MAFTLGNIGSLFGDDEEKKKKGMMSPITDKNALGNVLEQKAAAELTGDPNIDTSQQSRLDKKPIQEEEVGVDYGKLLEGLGRLSELQPKKGPTGSGSSVSSQILSGAGRLGTGLTLKDILKYRP